MEFEELKTKYTQLREFALETLRYEYRERADWNILYANCNHLEVEKDALKRKNEALQKENEALQKENEALRKEILLTEKLNKNNVYNEFQLIIKEKEKQFENEFPPIESNEKE